MIKRVRKLENPESVWDDRSKNVRVFNLELSEDGKATAEREFAGLSTEQTSSREEIVIAPDASGPNQPTSPKIIVSIPARPKPPQSSAEAHLYLSSMHKFGSGNHSEVYKAEWELPRSLLVDDILCQVCLREAVAQDMQGIFKRKECPYSTVSRPNDQARSNDNTSLSPLFIFKLDASAAKVTFADKMIPGETVKTARRPQPASECESPTERFEVRPT